MSGDVGRPNVEAVLATLKPFQRRSVEYAFERLYLAKDSTRRFLVADEVGLGKTLVARGLVAKAIDHLWCVPEVGDRIDIVYICSNARIARQNINRLNLSGSSDFAFSTRITLLPLEVRNLHGNKLNFIALTPGTSLDLKDPLGQMQERVLLCQMMQKIWPTGKQGTRRLFQGYVKSFEHFSSCVDALDPKSIDAGLWESFGMHLARRLETAPAGTPNLRDRYEGACKRFRWASAMNDPVAKSERGEVVLALRRHLAEACVCALEPDLVILDEFQRFKDLLDTDTEQAALARELFTYAEIGEVRVLLLSATPYKMLTLAHEQEQDDHYEDFLRTYAFLANSAAAKRELGARLREMRRALYGIAQGDAGGVAPARREVEERLRRVMSRTERRALAGTGDGMTRQTRHELPLAADEVRRFRRLQRLARSLDQPQVLDYWKSGSYLLNFMEDYALKRGLERRAEAPDGFDDLAEDLAADLLLEWEDVRGYRTIPAKNPRLGHLVEELDRESAWELLWAPPCLPYYRLGSPYREAAAAGFTKHLIFSSWAVVPRLIASFVSYEVERRLFSAFDPERTNTAEDRKRLRGLLRFTVSRGRLSGMPVLALLYPSTALALLADPLALPTAAREGADQALAAIRVRVSPYVNALVERFAEEGEFPDERWYWAAPMLLDARLHPEVTEAWFGRRGLDSLWQGDAAAAGEEEAEDVEDGEAAGAGEDAEAGEGAPDDDGGSRWSEHVEEAQRLLRGEVELGPAPTDLDEVLTLLGAAGPAVAALRAIGRVTGGESAFADVTVRDAAASVGWGFRTLFNRPETMVLLRSDEGAEASYWRRVLEHSVGGCLQAVLDEYAHVLRDLLGLFGRPTVESAHEIAAAMLDALTLRTPSTQADEIRVDRTGRRIHFDPVRLRNHFALRFAAIPGETGKTAIREDQVRSAFNSPFWPFVLATTSMGQEGLDFHPYCHRVVHWNLPTNPVDLEQREGRVHRYKGHAVRKNVASRCDGVSAADGSPDLWSTLFERVHADSGDRSGLIPYWLVPDGPAKVESSAAFLPHSRDQALYDDLRRSLAVYRMVFGQPAQEDLLDFLLRQVGEGEVRELVKEAVVDLSPGAGSQRPRP